ncbi:hypothetical protein L1987_40684 [Smallanthus sonchifolius]|uniref:Uncharacterized protein n=1 Tax=Smallanthus sonchifolius TaxID=185202 RepID=A0ACB9GTQ0_9ASTR|nr:hypothetical protein L1987_40684 [Smallanthus sonchifolius]
MENNKDLEVEYTRGNLEMHTKAYFVEQMEIERIERDMVEIVVAWLASIMTKELQEKEMREMEKAEEISLRKRVVDNISTTYSRRPKKAKVVSDPEPEMIKSPEKVQAPEKPRYPVITFSRKKSFPFERKYIKRKLTPAKTPKSLETIRFKSPIVVTSSIKVDVEAGKIKEDYITFLKKHNFRSKQMKNIKIENLKTHVDRIKQERDITSIYDSLNET